MLFITNRFPRQSIKTRIHRNFDFDLANNAASNSVFFCERLGHEVYEEIGSKRFLQRLKAARHRQILIYLHGDSNLPEDVFPAVEEFQALCEAQEPEEALVVPLIWPCDNDMGAVQDYWDDQESADLSGFSFARVLQKFLAWRELEQFEENAAPCLKRINLLPHSMGNRVVVEPSPACSSRWTGCPGSAPRWPFASPPATTFPATRAPATRTARRTDGLSRRAMAAPVPER
ncbi:alpha/beta hydrolase [Halomonas sp. M4R1S46]|uniref:alpha/beta hydrolase n=1 Tax=Halomonas sp. M4R1S46 TaxID=2982692 RepID=UPI0021E45E0B|nr:alpha/beta hydrolase [Halomonas sp. M4R1S46]UYG06518.1 alpha/beta hydrolase [Halomonas sp. M4R1S46]